jgi:sec-independent protein translocase protein TatA
MKKLPRLNPNTMYVLGFGELLLIALVLVVFFGAKRIPEIAKGLGGGIKSFKNEMKEPEEPRMLPPEDRDRPA